MDKERVAMIRSIIGDCQKTKAVVAIIQEYEREKEEQRRRKQAEGIARAKAAGKQIGRPQKERGPAFYALRRDYLQGLTSANAAAKKLGISCKTFITWAREPVPCEHGGQQSD